MGTGNLLAGNLGIPHRLDRAVEVLTNGGRRRIDLGRVTVGDDRLHFSVACGIGFDAEVMKATEKSQKDRWGKLAYVASAIRQSRRVRDVTHTISIDGVDSTMEATQVFIANFGKMLPIVQPRRKIRPDDGYLDVIVVRASGPLPGLMASWEAILQQDLGSTSSGRVFRARAREIRIETKPVRLVEADGSSVGRTPLVATVLPKALRVIVPRS
jgi:diacylglycerol kinase family enzyme